MDKLTKKHPTAEMVGRLAGSILRHLLRGALLMVAWNAISAVCSLPTFSYWVYVAVAYTVHWVLCALSPAIHVTDKK